jgi:hypothetical protein
MVPHNDCDWDQKKELVFAKIASIQGYIKVQTEDIKCLQKKVSDLQGDMKANNVVLIEIQKNVDEIKEDIKKHNMRNNSKISQVNVDIGKIQTRFTTYAAIASFVVATGVSLLLKFVF